VVAVVHISVSFPSWSLNLEMRRLQLLFTLTVA